MKRVFAILCALALTLSFLSGCGQQTAQEGEKKLSVVTTIFPVYDWVRNVLGDRADTVELTMLLDNGVDLHSYQPTADDMVKVATCDLFLYVGGESDQWVEDALKEAVNKDMVVLNLMELLGDAVKEEEIVEGMEADHDDHDHDDDDHDDHDDGHHDHEEGPEYDEHIWLSLENVEELVEMIGKTLGELDRDHREDYTANAGAYAEKLEALDNQYESAVRAGRYHTILFGDRFPFRYLADDYDLNYYAAFVGCSAETEASFETVAFLAGKVDQLGLPAVLTIESGDGKIARTIVETTKAKSAQILTMDSLQSTTMADVEQGATYLGAMEKNLDVLKAALG